MKITQYDDLYSMRIGSGETTLVSGGSGGSNSGFGGDVTGSWGDLSVVGLRRTVSLSSNLAPSAAVGNVLTLISAGGTPVAQFAVPSNSGGASAGSNSTRVSKNSSAGVATTFSPSDHIHDGIGSITASSSNTAGRGTFNIRQGNNVDLGWTDTDGDGLLDTVTINARASTSTGGSSGGSLTAQYPSLKPGTPTYDFATASLPGAFSAHSSGGSFATTSCMTQGAEPWPGTTLEMQFSAEMGRLQLTHSNTDLDFSWGGVESSMNDGAANTLAFGIAAVDSAGNGIMVASETGAIYFGKVVARQFTTVLDSWAGRGVVTTNQMRSGSMWFRLKRVSGTWTGYASVSGRSWEKTFATDATAYTVATLEFGLFYNTALTYVGRLLSDYIQVDV